MSDTTTTRRIRLATAAVWLCAAVFSLVAVGAALVLAKGGALLTFGGASGDLDVVQLGMLDSAIPRDGLDPVLADVPTANRLLFAVAPLVTAASWVVVAALVTGVLREIGAGRPFGPTVVGRLPRAAMVLGAGALLHLLADVVATVAFMASPRVGDLFSGMGSSGFDFPGTTFVCAVLIGALAVAFRQGAAIERELVGLV